MLLLQLYLKVKYWGETYSFSKPKHCLKSKPIKIGFGPSIMTHSTSRILEPIQTVTIYYSNIAPDQNPGGSRQSSLLLAPRLIYSFSFAWLQTIEMKKKRASSRTLFDTLLFTTIFLQLPRNALMCSWTHLSNSLDIGVQSYFSSFHVQ